MDPNIPQFSSSHETKGFPLYEEINTTTAKCTFYLTVNPVAKKYNPKAPPLGTFRIKVLGELLILYLWKIVMV